MSALAVLHVQWDLRRQDHELVQGQFRTVAVAHNEQPKMRTALLGL